MATTQKQDRMGWRWALALVPAILVAHEAHESAHSLVGRLACGQWAERDFSRWSISGCESVWPTLAGPLLSYALMAAGALVLLRGRVRWIGLALVFAANPLARMVTAATGHGDEPWVARTLAGGSAHPDAWAWAAAVVVVLLAGAALTAAWRALRGVRGRVAVFGLGAVAGIAVTGPLMPALNRLLGNAALATPVAGAPWLVHGLTLLSLAAMLCSIRWLTNPEEAVGNAWSGR